MSFLDQVQEQKRKTIEKLKNFSLAGKTSRPGGKKALDLLQKRVQKGGFFVIAEVKKASPSKGLINTGINSVLRAKLYEESGASAISILTDEKWFKGSFDELKEVATHVRVPVLMKDFIIDPIQLHLAASYGASLVLLIVKLLKNELKRYFELCYEHDLLPLVEISNEEEFEIALQTGCPLIGVNSRDLDTLEVDFRKFFKLSDLVKKAASYGTLVVAESGLSTREEVMDILNLGYHGVLIGTRLSQADGVEFLQTITSAKLNGGDF